MGRAVATQRGPWQRYLRALRRHIVAGFEHESDAVRFPAELHVRLERFALSLHQDKTRLIEFGRHAADNREKPLHVPARKHDNANIRVRPPIKHARIHFGWMRVMAEFAPLREGLLGSWDC
jgi:hypothetical protein